MQKVPFYDHRGVEKWIQNDYATDLIARSNDNVLPNHTDSTAHCTAPRAEESTRVCHSNDCVVYNVTLRNLIC